MVHVLAEAHRKTPQAVEWFLLTTIEMPAADAKEYLRWYTCVGASKIDRVLKSGCRIEDLGHESAERFRRAIVVNFTAG